MKVLSLLQPWASLVVMGVKQIETRAWNTAYRGELLIHAGKSKRAQLVAQHDVFKKHIPRFHQLPFGAIIGSVVLTNVLRFDQHDAFDERIARLTLEEKAFGDYVTGRYGLVFTEARMFTQPVPARGFIHMWEWHGPLPPMP
jgi:hypothetical protein